MRQDRFQPAGPPALPAWSDMLRSVPIALVAAGISGVFGWGVSYATFKAKLDEQAAWIGRVEVQQQKDALAGRTSQDKEVAALYAALNSGLARVEAGGIERTGRLERDTNTRFDAYDKRGDARMLMLTTRFEKGDTRDETVADALNQLNVRMTRIETIREFNQANGARK